MPETWEVNDNDIFLCRLGRKWKGILRFKRQFRIVEQLLSGDQAEGGKRKNVF